MTGVGNAEKLEQDFFGVLRSQKFNAILISQAYKYIIDRKTILAFFIPSSPQKPIYFNTPINTFIRCGSGDQRATNSEIIQNEIDYVAVTFDIKSRKGGQIGGQIGGQMPKNRIEVLRLVVENNYITHKELTRKIGIASSAIQKHLEVLVNEGYIKREGKTRSSYWIILKQDELNSHEK